MWDEEFLIPPERSPPGQTPDWLCPAPLPPDPHLPGFLARLPTPKLVGQLRRAGALLADGMAAVQQGSESMDRFEGCAVELIQVIKHLSTLEIAEPGPASPQGTRAGQDEQLEALKAGNRVLRRKLVQSGQSLVTATEHREGVQVENGPDNCSERSVQAQLSSMQQLVAKGQSQQAATQRELTTQTRRADQATAQAREFEQRAQQAEQASCRLEQRCRYLEGRVLQLSGSAATDPQSKKIARMYSARNQRPPQLARKPKEPTPPKRMRPRTAMTRMGLHGAKMHRGRTRWQPPERHSTVECANGTPECRNGT